MKKLNNYFLVAVLVAASFTFGCKKDKADVVPGNGSATISGIVKYDFNIANDTSSTPGCCGSGTPGAKTYDSPLPAGLIPIIATINTKDLVLNPNNNIVYPTKEYRTTVNTDGTYSFTIDANENPVTVTITTGQFRNNQIGPVGSRAPKSTSQVYGGETITNTLKVVNGDSKIQDFTSNQ
jgi:hypothetical protein